MSIHVKAEEAILWYKQKRIFYNALANKVEVIVKELLKLNDINYHSVSSRGKTVESYRRKAHKEKYKDPRSEIMDMAGIRVITYTDSDAKKVAEIIKARAAFEIYPEFSVDKTEELGVDRVGYRGIHYIANLGEQRLSLPENNIFKDFIFEIQIRSILQHAWAEFEHDRNYKFSGVLPKEIRRRFSLAAANLESVDRDFDDIAKAIDGYTLDVEKRTKIGKLSIPINSTSLMTYLKSKFQPLIKQGIVEPDFAGLDAIIVDELRIMNINTLAKLKSIIPADFVNRAGPYYKDILEGCTNFAGIVRDILIIHDAGTYFEKAWKDRWQGLERATAFLYRSYGVDIDKYIDECDLDLT